MWIASAERTIFAGLSLSAKKDQLKLCLLYPQSEPVKKGFATERLFWVALRTYPLYEAYLAFLGLLEQDRHIYP